MSPEPSKHPGRIERGYEAFAKALGRVLVDIVGPITSFVIIYFILFGKVAHPAVALMLGGAASAFLGIPVWTRQDRARRRNDEEGDGGGGGGSFTITVGRQSRRRPKDDG